MMWQKEWHRYLEPGMATIQGAQGWFYKISWFQSDFCQFWALRMFAKSVFRSVMSDGELCCREWPLTIAFCCGSITILSRSSGPELRCCDMLRHSSKMSPFEILRKIHKLHKMIWSYLIVIESVDGKWWQQQEAFEPFALLCDFTSDTAHCAACAKLCESVWVVFVLILSLAEDRCDFNHLRDSHPQPGRFSDDTASTKKYNKLSWKMPRISFSTLNSVLKSPLKYVRCLWFPDLTEVYCLDSNND